MTALMQAFVGPEQVAVAIAAIALVAMAVVGHSRIANSDAEAV